MSTRNFRAYCSRSQRGCRFAEKRIKIGQAMDGGAAIPRATQVDLEGQMATIAHAIRLPTVLHVCDTPSEGAPPVATMRWSILA